MYKKTVLASIFIVTTGQAIAVNLDCYETPGSLQNTCVAPSLTTANGDLRASPVFMGGPKAIRRVSFSAVANCKTKILMLQNNDGSNFSGGAASSTPTSQVLFKSLCGVKNPKQDKSLRIK